MLENHAKDTLPRNKDIYKGMLDLVHLDVCGPMSVASITRIMYCVSLIDDFFCKIWIYFLKTKDGVFSRFQEFKALFENYKWKKIKVLRSNNGGEYTSKDFEGFYKET
jgi:hypothetical protein